MSELKQILLAEDSEDDAELTTAALRENHIANDIVLVRDGEEALDYLYRRGAYQSRPEVMPTVVLLDLKMPKVDGLEVLKTLRADARMKTLPVVILTSSRQESDIVESYQLGVNAYVVKPVKFQQFAEAVRVLGLFWAVLNESPPVRSRSVA